MCAFPSGAVGDDTPTSLLEAAAGCPAGPDQRRDNVPFHVVGGLGEEIWGQVAQAIGLSAPLAMG
jgi:hypothetical protein